MVKQIIHTCDWQVDKESEFRNKGFIDFKNQYIDNLKSNSLNLNFEERLQICVGDLYENFNIGSNTATDILIDAIREMLIYSPVIIVAGNHDYNEGNQFTTNILDVVYKAINNPNLHYYNESKCYQYDNDLIFVNYCHFTGSNKPDDFSEMKDINQYSTFIGLYHETVESAKTLYITFNECNRKIEQFEGLDAVLMGHIHLHQGFEIDYCHAVYAGSPYQLTSGEPIFGHGIVEWDVTTKNPNPNFVELDSRYIILSVKINNFDDFNDPSKLVINNLTVDRNEDLLSNHLYLFERSDVKVKLNWHDFSSNMSQLARHQLKLSFSEKYNVKVENIEIKPHGIRKKVLQDEKNQSLGEKIKGEIFDKKNLKQAYIDYIENNEIDIDINEFEQLDKLIDSRIINDTVVKNTYSINFIEVENLLSFEKYVYDSSKKIGDGITLIQSLPVNGGGKTNGVKFNPILLHGTYKITNGRITLDELFNNITDSNKAFIYGEIDINSTKYIISRVYTKNKTGDKVSQKLIFGEIVVKENATNFFDTDEMSMIDLNRHTKFHSGHFIKSKNGKNAAITQSIINEQIGSIDDFYYSAMFDAKNVDKWLDTKPTERVQLFFTYFGLDMFTKKYDACNDLYKDFKKSSKLATISVPTLEGKIEDEYIKIHSADRNSESLEIEISKNSNQIALLDEKIVEQATNLYQLPVEFDNFDLEKNSNQIIDNQLIINDNNKNIVDDELKCEIIVFNNVKESCENKIGEIDGLILNYTLDSPLIDELSEMENERNNYSVNPNLSSQLNQKREDRNDLVISYKTYNSSYNEYKKLYDELGESITCEYCDKSIQDVSKKKNEYMLRMNDLKALIQKSKEEGINVKKHIESLDEKIKHDKIDFLGNILVKINNLKSKISQLEKSGKQLLSDSKQIYIDDLKKYQLIDDYKNNIERNQNANEKLQLKNNQLQILIDSYNNSIGKIEKNKAINDIIKEFQLTKDELNEYRKEYNKLLNEEKTNLKVAKRAILNYEDEIDSLESDIKQDKLYTQYLSIHDKFSGIQRFIVERYIPIINLELKSLLNECTDFSVKIVFKDKRIDFVFEKSGYEVLLHNASGYQKTSCGLALHFILMKLTTINLPNCIFIDEIFGAIGDMNLEYVNNIISKMTEIYDNIFLITHNKTILENWGSNLQIIVKDDKYSHLLEGDNIEKQYKEIIDKLTLIKSFKNRSIAEQEYIAKLLI